MRPAARGWLLVGVLTVLAYACPAPGAEQDQYEERAMQRCVERGAMKMYQHTRSMRAMWLKAMEAAYPDRVTDKVRDAATEEEYEIWYDVLAGKSGEWRKDDSKNPQVNNLYEQVTNQLQLGPVPSIRREEFMRYLRNSGVMQRNNQNVGGQGDYGDLGAETDKVFRVLDRDGDGALTADELTVGLKEDRTAADTDGNGRISREEYREYFKRKVQAKLDAQIAKFVEQTGMNLDGTPVKPGQQGPTKFKNGLPDWFTTLDEDEDGQISLFEWRQGGKPFLTYQEMDLDGDGLLTKEEYLRYAKMKELEASENKPAKKRP